MCLRYKIHKVLFIFSSTTTRRSACSFINISFLLLKEIDNPAAKEYIQLKKYLGIPALTEELDKFLKIMGSQTLASSNTGLLDLEILLKWEPKLEI